MFDPAVAAVVSWDLEQIQAVKQFQADITADLLPKLSVNDAMKVVNYEFQLATLESYFFGTVLPQVLSFTSQQGV